MSRYHGVNELREMFLSFFESKGHLRLPSFSLIPQNDASLLLINSGMAPMKPYFTGEEEPPRHRVTHLPEVHPHAATSRTSARPRATAPTLRCWATSPSATTSSARPSHWAWEFLTSPEWVGLEPDRLYPSRLSRTTTRPSTSGTRRSASPPERIFRFGKEDNFWEHGSGPCGPCSEIYYDRGEKYGCGKPGLHRRLRLRPLYGGLEQRVLPVQQRRPRPLHRAGAEEHRHRHGSGASGRASARTWTPSSTSIPS